MGCLGEENLRGGVILLQDICSFSYFTFRAQKFPLNTFAFGARRRTNASCTLTIKTPMNLWKFCHDQDVDEFFLLLIVRNQHQKSVKIKNKSLFEELSSGRIASMWFFYQLLLHFLKQILLHFPAIFRIFL